MFLGKNSFFANDEQGVLNELSERCKCRVLPIVYPTAGGCTYCISEHGELFAFRRIIHTDKYVGYGPIKPHPNMQCENSVKFDIYIDKGRQTKLLAAAKLVYCTFVLQEWSDNLQLTFKDGNSMNPRLDNLEPYKEPVPTEWVERMENHADIYKRYFNHVVRVVEHRCNVSEQDAKDIAQGTFIYVITWKDFEIVTDFVGVWVKWAIIRSSDFTRHYQRFDCIDDYADLIGTPHVSYEVDLFAQIKNQKRQQIVRLFMQGCSQRDIAEMYGTSEASIRSTIYQEMKSLRSYIGKREINFLRG